MPLFDRALNSRDFIVYRKVIQRDPCSYCGEAAGGTKDHIVPKASGGKHDYSNLTGACRSCNFRKGSKTLLGYLYQRRWDERGTLDA